MTEAAKPRLNWGEPVELTGEQADDVRTLLQRFRSDPGELQRAYDRLFALFIPAPEVCAPLRQHIQEVEDHVSNIDSAPGIGDTAYEKFEENLSAVLGSAVDAFNSRPEGCEMESRDDMSRFECGRCNFDHCIFPTD